MKNSYYQKHKERFRKEARKKYQNLSEQEKNKGKKRPKKGVKILLNKKQEKNCQYHLEGNKNLSEEERKKLVEYRRNYYITNNK